MNDIQVIPNYKNIIYSFVHLFTLRQKYHTIRFFLPDILQENAKHFLATI